MYVRYCLVVKWREKCIGNCNCGKEGLRCWPTVRWPCEGGRISNDCSWLIPARQWGLEVLCVVVVVVNCWRIPLICNGNAVS